MQVVDVVDGRSERVGLFQVQTGLPCTLLLLLVRCVHTFQLDATKKRGRVGIALSCRFSRLNLLFLLLLILILILLSFFSEFVFSARDGPGIEKLVGRTSSRTKLGA